MKKASSWLWGIILVALGVILGVNALGIAKIDIFFPGWWTLFIIVPCFVSLLTEKHKGGALAGVVIGVCLLLACLGIVPFGIMWKLLLPIILVIVGLTVILHAMSNGEVNDKIREARRAQAEARHHSRAKTEHIAEGEIVSDKKKTKSERIDDDDDEDEDDDEEDEEFEQHAYWSTFSDQKIDFDGKTFEGCRIDAVFGGADLDLREAKIQNEAIVRASSVFGGIIIYVPDDVKVEVASSAIFGGVSDKRKTAKAKEQAKTTLYIDATCVFGGVEIR